MKAIAYDFNRGLELALIYHQTAHETLCRIEEGVAELNLSPPGISEAVRFNIRVNQCGGDVTFSSTHYLGLFDRMVLAAKEAAAELVRQCIEREETTIAELQRGGHAAQPRVSDYVATHPDLRVNVIKLKSVAASYARQELVHRTRLYGDKETQKYNRRVEDLTADPAAASLVLAERQVFQYIMQDMRAKIAAHCPALK
jgi:hypothetical protein